MGFSIAGMAMDALQLGILRFVAFVSDVIESGTDQSKAPTGLFSCPDASRPRPP